MDSANMTTYRQGDRGLLEGERANKGGLQDNRAGAKWDVAILHSPTLKSLSTRDKLNLFNLLILTTFPSSNTKP